MTTVDYGDGSGVQPLALSDKIFNLSQLYSDDGTYTVTVTVEDDDGGMGSDNVTITVNTITANNVAPTINASLYITVNEGSTFTNSGNFRALGASNLKRPSGDTHGQSPWHFTGQASLDLNPDPPAILHTQ